MKHNWKELLILLLICVVTVLFLYGTVKIERVISLLILMVLLSTYRYSKLIIYFSFLLAVFTCPIVLFYNIQVVDIISSVIETHQDEAFEQLSVIPIWLMISAVIYFVFSCYFYYKFKIKLKNKHKLLLAVIAIIMSFHRPLLKEYDKPLLEVRLPPIDYMYNVYDTYNQYITERDIINSNLNEYKSYQWPNSKTKPKYKNHVLIIGESVRKDYMSLYGYKHNTTPFFDNVNKTYWSNFITPSFSTLASVSRLLSENNGLSIEYKKNVMSLANSLGLNTYWLSNQGKFGVHETAITQFAYVSDHSYFSNLVNSSGSTIKDSDLLPHLKNVLENDEGNKFIVLHLMGSHTNFCKRIENSPKFEIGNSRMDCYVESILETDQMLSKVHTLLKNENQSFSMIYTADHGLIHTPDYSNLVHGLKQESLQSPLVKISSDMSKTILNKQYISGFDFIYYIMNWLNYQNQPIKYSLKDDVLIFSEEKLFNYINVSKEEK
ncbi:phosphoethanolamine transferase [Vibrio cortegadensis]|uniref:phosphoethanolamine transferase n=1 Tax=Vibrio cortegadensis TaxID=1328770 RepID=UPI00352F703F